MSLLEAFFWAIVVVFGIILFGFIIGYKDFDGDGGDDWGDFGGDG